MSVQQMNVIPIDMTRIHADEEFNCRGQITPADVADLARDIEQRGLLQPVIVMAYTDEERQKYGYDYRLIGGFRRFIAHKIINAKTISANVVAHMTESEAISNNLIENLNRKALTIMQEARAIKHLRDLGVGRKGVARMVGMGDGWVQVRFMLLDMPEPVQREVDAGLIPQGGIRALYTTLTKYGPEKCIEAAKLLKDARLKGQSSEEAVEKVRVKTGDTKKIRGRTEIEQMMTEVIMPITGESLATRALAWTCGNISDDELFNSIEEEAQLFNKGFIRPW